MIIKLLHLLEHLIGILLGGLGVGVQLGNVLVCIFMIVLGPAFVVRILAQ